MIRKIAKPIFIFIGIVLLFSLLVSWFALLVGFLYASPVFGYLLPGNAFVSTVAVGNILFLIGLPITGIILFFRRTFTRKRTNPMLKAGLWSFWILNLISFVTIGTFTARQFDSYADLDKVEVNTPVGDTLVIGSVPYAKTSGRIHLFDHSLIFDKEKMVTKSIEYHLEKSPDADFHIWANASAYGGSPTEATENAAQLSAQIEAQGEKIILPTHLSFLKGSKWRGQQMAYTIQVPEGKKIYFDRSLVDNLAYIDIDRSEPYPRPYHGQYWTMGAEGFYSEAFRQENNDLLQFENTDFSKVQVRGPIDILIEKSDQYSVQITGQNDQLSDLELEQISDLLVVSVKGGDHRYSPKLTISLPELQQLNLTNVEAAKISGFEQDKMSIKNEGKNKLRAFVKTKTLEVFLDGRCEAEFTGETDKFSLFIDDSSEIDASGLAARNARFESREYREAVLFVTDTLRYDLSSRSRLDVQGKPYMIDLREPRND